LLDLAAREPTTLMILVERLLTRTISSFQMLESVFDMVHVKGLQGRGTR